MKRNRILPLVLSVALTASLLVAPVNAATFTDISDPKIAAATEVLYHLGVVEGTGNGQFNPSGSLTRAEFCKMALIAMGRGGEARLHAGRVIFSDVTSGWALGYVNAAATAPAKDAPALMMGKGNGRFEPNSTIKYGEAVTTLMRSLGYAEKDVPIIGMWYDGYLATAQNIGLTKGISRNGTDTITRGEAALLFQNLLFTNTKTDGKPFVTSVLGGKVVENDLILSVNATMPDGSKNAVRTTTGTYKPSLGAFDAQYRGAQARLILDKNDLLLAIIPTISGTTRSVRVTADPQARFFKIAGGETVTVDGATPTWRSDKGAGTYATEYMNIKVGDTLTLSYNAAGNLASIYIMGNEQGDAAMVARSTSGNPFAALTGGDTKFTIVKNGSPATLSDIRQYDVGTYNLNTGVLTVTDNRLTGIYTKAVPSPASPSTITVLGHDFTVLDCALEDFSNFKVGDSITLLLTADNKVAGAVKPSVLSGTAVGIASIPSNKQDKKEATVTLTSGLVIKGNVSMSDATAESLSGKLVTVSSYKIGELSIRSVSGSTASGSWNVKKGTVGSLTLSPGASLYERMGTSQLFPVALGDVTVASVPASKITYISTNFKGEVDLMVVENVTGDHFQYGLPDFTPATSNPNDPWIFDNATIAVKIGKKVSPALVTGADFSTLRNTPVGIAASVQALDGKQKMASWVQLTKGENVRRSAFDGDFVTVNGQKFPLDPRIDAQCYNATTKEEFASLDAAKAYATTFTVYYDRPANEGGKIRVVTAE
ncbi:MAG: S-layer homology domain-containing protein [Oscillospiraceae bacterium]